MPSLLADYLARLNLLLVALTIALLLVIATQLLLIIGDMLMLAATAIASIFRRKPRKTGPVDLPPLDLDASNRVSRPGSKILGGGFDSLDRD